MARALELNKPASILCALYSPFLVQSHGRVTSPEVLSWGYHDSRIILTSPQASEFIVDSATITSRLSHENLDECLTVNFTETSRFLVNRL